MRVDVVTIFPDYLAPLDLSLIGKARRDGILDVRVHDLRDVAHDRHRTVDDSPFGGGAGMVMTPGPWAEALDAVVASGPAGDAAVPHLVVPGPGGVPFSQALARSLADEPWLAFACGATRASTSGCTSTRLSGCRSRSSRSATTCSTAARWPCWPWSRPSAGCCPGSSATPSRSSRSRTRTACSSTPSTPAPPPGTTPARCARCRRSCSRATTGRSPRGDTSSDSSAGIPAPRPASGVGHGGNARRSRRAGRDPRRCR